LAALLGLALIQRRHGKEPLFIDSLSRVGLAWLAGHGSYSNPSATSALLALAFALAAWGNLRIVSAQRWGPWLLNSGQVFAIVVLLSARQPIPAGLAGMLLLGQVALQPSLGYGELAARTVVSRRTWPWLMLAMLVVAWALP
jgi:hypothetical protein